MISDEIAMRYFLKKWFFILSRSSKCFLAEDYAYRASGLAFTTLLSIVPLLSVIVFVISLFPYFREYLNIAQDYLFTNFIPASNQVIQTNLEKFIKKSYHLPIVSFAFLFVTTTLMMVTIVRTLNDIWHVHKKHISFFYWTIYWLILLLAPIVIGISISLSTYLFSLIKFSTISSFTVYLLVFSSICLNTIIFGMMYVIIPNRHIKWKEGFAGGFIAAFLFEIAKKGFILYVYFFPGYQLIYGVLSAIPIFLIWIYILWMIVLYGALITHDLYTRRITHAD